MKHYYLLPLVIFVFCLSCVNVYGQNIQPSNNVTNQEPNPNFCGTDFFHNIKMENDPIYRARHINAIQSIQKISSQKTILPGGILQVPVVVHVMHKGEAIGTGTNISDEDVKLGIQYLNNYWRKVSGSEGDGDGVDMKIEFALAVQDENGNCTNGIDRVDMSGVPAYVSNGVNRLNTDGIPDYSSGGGINSLKEYSIWDTTEYYNVWIVDEIDNKNCSGPGSFTAGYAYYASAHGQLYDGSVVLICSYLNESSSTWAHEMGHAFNLPHTFDGDDSNGDGIGDQCGDDGIADTPSHIRTSSISPSIYFDCNNNDANTCDALFNQITNPDTGFVRNTGTHQDHMHNYMDYTGCATEFTGGQRSVVTNALNVTRASFLTSPALTPPATATVYFTSTATSACLGNDITFYDESTCTPNTYTNTGYDNVTFAWTFDNGVDTPYTSTLQNPTITFSNSGTYDVTLEITNPAGTTSLTKTGNIAVTSGVAASCSISSTNNDNNFSNGVTNVSFNNLNNSTSTFIPASAMQDFTCTDNTDIYMGFAYDLDVTYQSRNDGGQNLEVWIDWDNSGTFDTNNTNGVNERVLIDNIPASTTNVASASITPPATAVLNTLLRMRVISDYNQAPTLCGNGFVQRADDYGVYVKPACTPPSAGITNNSGFVELTCIAPSISLTATGGVSYQWDNNKGIDPNITVTEPGTYNVIVTSADGCTDTESIIITENKPAPSAVITNNTGSTALTCSVSSISLTASGGVSYSWDNSLGNNASVSITTSGTYTVTVTAANGCIDTESITITNEAATPSSCTPSSFNDNGNFGCGVTNVNFNTISNATSTYVPPGAINDFICSNNTTLVVSTAYSLSIDYRARVDGDQNLEVWIDWDNNGNFELSNSNGNNEQVLIDNITQGTTGSPTVNVTPPSTTVLGVLLRMRVISSYNGAPNMCGSSTLQRIDDYGVSVNTTLSTNEVNGVNSGIKIYPNPVETHLNVSLGSTQAVKGYEVYDISGKKLINKETKSLENINVSNLPSGFYFLKIKTDLGESVSKFVKK